MLDTKPQKTKIIKEKKRWFTLDKLLLLFSIYTVLLTLAIGVLSVRLFLLVLVINIIITAAVFVVTKKYRNLVSSVLYGRKNDGSNTQYNLETLVLPVVIVISKRIVWYNQAFRESILDGKDDYLDSVFKLFPSFDAEKCQNINGQNIAYCGKKYSVFGSGVNNEDSMMVLYFVDDTNLKQVQNEYQLSRPCVMHIMLDTYDEMKKDLKESERARVMGDINLVLEKYIGKTTGFLQRTAADKYVALIEERHIERFIEERFDILDKVRQIGGEYGLTTLSVGIGRDGNTFEECENMANSALDMALGRGGDQVAVKTDEGYTFFGGVAQGVEKRSKVKARIVSNALCELIEVSDSVVVMGHRLSDMDSIGAAAGVLRICSMLEKPACIAVNQRATLAANLINKLKKSGLSDSIYSPEDIMPMVTAQTLLIVVDTHIAGLLESKDLYSICKNVVVIDHHRKMVGHIDNAIIFYHEPYASSACELVSELIQYALKKEDKLLPAQAEALLAGIMLDTRDFTVHTGVRTFEAAAYLRRMGAQTVETKKLFSSNLESYAHKARLVTSAKIYKDCAISLCDELPDDMRVVIPQAANDLLAIEGVKASFVAINLGDVISVSARSLGEINVQVVMESLGGGGHLTMAGTQFLDTDMPTVQKNLQAAIDNYYNEKRKEEQK